MNLTTYTFSVCSIDVRILPLAECDCRTNVYTYLRIGHCRKHRSDIMKLKVSCRMCLLLSNSGAEAAACAVAIISGTVILWQARLLRYTLTSVCLMKSWNASFSQVIRVRVYLVACLQLFTRVHFLACFQRYNPV